MNKHVAVGIAALLASMGAQAVDLVISNSVATGINPGSSFSVSVPGFTAAGGTIGTLTIDGPGVVTYTYLGKEAGFSNRFFNTGGTTSPILDTASVGSTSQQTYGAAGPLSFSFGTVSPNVGVANGTATNTSPTFAIFAGGTSPYKWIIGYDDSGAGPDRDFDDMVIGITAVPEPEAYGLALAGMGVVAFAMRRRRAD